MILSIMLNPPFTHTSKIINLLSEITFLLGKAETRGLEVPGPQLRKSNTIKTIQATLAIEGNTLSEKQITAILEGKKIKGRANEILEVKNAISLYKKMDSFDYTKTKDFLKANGLLMKGLVKNPGKYRNKNMGVLKGKKVVHTAPQPKMVPQLMKEHLEWLKKEDEVHLIIKSCISHYEIEFIHPFMDGNGRMGRFWQTLILSQLSLVFRYLPIESIIKEKQSEYYKSLEMSDEKGESTPFIEFNLGTLKSGLEEFIEKAPTTNNTQEKRLELAKSKFKDKPFSRKEYMNGVPEISTATASRDLAQWHEQGELKKKGEHNQTKYYFHKPTK